MNTVNTMALGTSRRLRIYNAVAALVHLLQAVAVLSLTNDFSIPVTALFLDGPPGTDPGTITTLFNFRVGWGVAGFLLMSAVAHLILILPRVFPWYIGQLETKRNYARWIEYSFSSSLMIVIIAMLPGTPSWVSYSFGIVTGSVPWIAIAVYLWSPGSSATPPAFVYGIFFSLFIFFNSFALNMVLQYKRTWRWRSYIFGEKTYIFLSLTAKSLLAWQVFAGTLVPS
jgi:hypothetical protein